MLLCKKCGCLVVHSPGTIVPQQTVECVTPDCLSQQFPTGKDGNAEAIAYIKENCSILQIDDALDREPKLGELLWWINTRKAVTSEREHADEPASHLLTVEAAVQEVVVYHAQNIVTTLTRKKK